MIPPSSSHHHTKQSSKPRLEWDLSLEISAHRHIGHAGTFGQYDQPYVYVGFSIT